MKGLEIQVKGKLSYFKLNNIELNAQLIWEKTWFTGLRIGDYLE